ncbi:MAG: flagellar hook-associated protein FlgK [bacterium]|nr:flagellar hook-associated protein FlgK [bacterium]
MGSGVSSLLDISKRSLFNQSQAIRVIGNNIANVNTEGYSRRKVDIKSSDSFDTGEGTSFGTGADIDSVYRTVDKFINLAYQGRIGDRARSEARDEFLARLEPMFALDGSTKTISSELSGFFSAIEDLAQNPSDVSLRRNVLDQGQNLATTINRVYSQVSQLQREADDRINYLVEEVNRIGGQIANLNSQISGKEDGSQELLTARDQREQLVRDLSEIMSVTTVENSDGSTLVTIGNGFALVSGIHSNALETSKSPSFAPVGGYPKGLDGDALSFIVHDFDTGAGTSHADFTGTIAAGGGELGGLLSLRGVQSATDTTAFDAVGDFVTAASMVEAIAEDLLTRFNLSYLGPDENGGTAFHNPSSGDLAGSTPASPYSLFNFTGAADLDADGRPDDLAGLRTALTIPSFAEIIQFGVTSEQQLAAALDLDPAAGSLSFTTGDSRNLDNLAALRQQKVAYSVGNFNQTSSLEEVYDTLTSTVGSLRATSKNQFALDKDRETMAKELYSSTSGVSLDEEFANLITFQKAYEASARLVRVGDEMLTEVIGLLG